MLHAAQFVANVAASGSHHFTTEAAVDALGGSVAAVRAALRRLQGKGEIADPYRGFYVIVPPEYRKLGCLPADQFVPQLMDHLDEPYYVALLSAAELHGAAHHHPQSLQVMTRSNRRPIVCGDVRVQFVARKDLDVTPIVEKNTPRGRLRVASAEATALEVVGYADHCGGLDNVAAVLEDLSDLLVAEKLANAARLCPVVWSQRLGYLLDLVGQTALSETLVPYVKERAQMAPLVRAVPRNGAPSAERWKLAVNVTVEPKA